LENPGSRTLEKVEKCSRFVLWTFVFVILLLDLACALMQAVAAIVKPVVAIANTAIAIMHSTRVIPFLLVFIILTSLLHYEAA
jgi:hypothetical protein